MKVSQLHYYLQNIHIIVDSLTYAQSTNISYLQVAQKNKFYMWLSTTVFKLYLIAFISPIPCYVVSYAGKINAKNSCFHIIYFHEIREILWFTFFLEGRLVCLFFKAVMDPEQVLNLTYIEAKLCCLWSKSPSIKWMKIITCVHKNFESPQCLLKAAIRILNAYPHA